MNISQKQIHDSRGLSYFCSLVLDKFYSNALAFSKKKNWKKKRT